MDETRGEVAGTRAHVSIIANKVSNARSSTSLLEHLGVSSAAGSVGCY